LPRIVRLKLLYDAEKEVKAEAKRFTLKKSQFQKKENENTAQPPVEEEETNNGKVRRVGGFIRQ